MRPKDKDGLAVIAALREAEDAIGAAMQCAARTMDTIDTLRVRVAELEGLLREVSTAGVELDDPRIGYLTVQIDRDTWNEIKAALRGEEVKGD